MKLTIYRGTNEIGGNCIELEHNTVRILLDFGIPLEVMSFKDVMLQDYKQNLKEKYDAVFISHAHPDHYGLIEFIDNKTPIYSSKETCELLKNIAPLTTRFKTKNLNLKQLKNNIKIGEFDIVPHNIDHSIVGSYAFEIRCCDKTILYTGDIRFHGRCAYKNSALIRKIGKVDYLIMEGTTISREKTKRVSEDDLVALFIKEFEKVKLSLIQVSSQNLDRFISIYKACLSAKKILVIDAYTCFLLELYGKHNKNIPQYYWNNIRVFRDENSITKELDKKGKLSNYLKKEILIEEIISDFHKYVVKGNFYINRILLNKIPKENLNIIYSMWKGYLKNTDYLNYFADEIKHIHTSGHATVDDLQTFVNTIKPKAIIPIHTECKTKYEELFNAKIINIEDGMTIEL